MAKNLLKSVEEIITRYVTFIIIVALYPEEPPEIQQANHTSYWYYLSGELSAEKTVGMYK